MAAIDKERVGLTVMVLHDERTAMERLRHDVDFAVAGGIITFDVPSFIKGPFTAEISYTIDPMTTASNCPEFTPKDKPQRAWLQLQPNNESWRSKKRGKK